MIAGIFTPNQDDAHHDKTLRAFAEGVENSGDECFIAPVDRYSDCDVAIVFGVRKDALPRSKYRGDIIDRHKAADKPVVVIDSGYLKRDKYFAIGLGGLNGRANFKNRDSKSDRWTELGLSLEPWRVEGGHVLICGQIPWDAACQHVNHIEWCQRTVTEVRKRTTSPILFRPHPGCAGRVNYDVDCRVSSNPKIADDIRDAACVITFNSNAGVDALLAGVPVFAFDSGSMAWDIANKDYARLNSPLRPDRQQWAHNLAYTQWTIEEMKEGKPWRHLCH